MADSKAAPKISKKRKVMIFFAVILIIVLLLFILTCVEMILGFHEDSPFSAGNIIEPIGSPAGIKDCAVMNKENFLSKAATFLINPITMQVNMVSQEIFIQIINNPTYHRIIFVILTLYIVIWGIYIALGFTQTSLKDFISRVFKIGIVLSLIHPYSFNFFNQYLFGLFIDGSQELIGMVANPYCDSSNSSVNYFAFTNYAIHTFFDSPYLLLRISSTIVAFPIGWLCFIVFCLAMFSYFVAVLRAILAYLIAYTAVGLVISLGPIFIVTLLFERTKHLFTGWMGALVSFAMEPVILFATIVLVTLFVDQALYDVMGQLEWLPFLDFHINFKAPSTCGDNWYCVKITKLRWYLPSFYNNSLGVKDGQGLIGGLLNIQNYVGYIQSFIVLTIGVGLLNKVGEFSTQISSYLFGGAGMLSAANNVASSIKNTGKSIIGMDDKSKQRRGEQDQKAGAASAKAERAKRFGPGKK